MVKGKKKGNKKKVTKEKLKRKLCSVQHYT